MQLFEMPSCVILPKKALALRVVKKEENGAKVCLVTIIVIPLCP
jgi:hypothetical protein